MELSYVFHVFVDYHKWLSMILIFLYVGEPGMAVNPGEVEVATNFS